MRFFLALLPLPILAGETITVSGNDELAEALGRIKAHTTLVIGSGEYRGGWSLRDLAHLTIKGDPKKPPRFLGGKQAWHFSKCHHLSLEYLECAGQELNGINIDDGGDYSSPTKHIKLSHLKISDIGPKGNFDALKCSGLDHLKITHCEFSGWGGQAIDFVGCHQSSISHCKFTGKEGYSQTTGPQFKGGCQDITIENCTFLKAGSRPIQAGGSTGMAYFRPPGAKFEARRITIRNNTIVGSPCAVTFTGVDGAEFCNNLIIHPTKWIMRILQETTAPGFPPCRNVDVHHNVIVFQRSQVRIAANIGSNTAPESFSFHNNLWFASDKPEASKPSLPSNETGSHYGIDPGLEGHKVTSPLALKILGQK